MPQQTLVSSTCLRGVGLHTGVEVVLRLLPAPPNTGIVFKRIDLPEHISIPVTPFNIQQSRLNSTLQLGEVKILTIEHLMSALSGLGIDNVYVEIDGPEVPIMDGSSAPFMFAIQTAGIKTQAAPRKVLCITRVVCVKEQDKYAKFSPSQAFEVEVEIDFSHPVLKNTVSKVQTILNTPANYINTVSYARTFGFVKELEELHKNNLARGASLENVIAIDDDKVVNPDGLRYPDEFARHKVLDAIGDLYTAGPIRGKFTGYKVGHYLNNSLLRKVLEDKENYIWEEE
ncbi:MAG: UDP-3-O-[3-hydroxymyristoyl] N-acetylglucosamine deacetylase [Thiotrichales bacterium]|nr:MAG: UDP-3-O-[3-hydroxymyristoyl] N-acetylglucosamine deacetylase [Thiotrichales bacterium]